MTEEELMQYRNVPPPVAAKYLDKSPPFVYKGLQCGRLPFGTAVQMDGGKWSYDIPPKSLIAYVNGTLPVIMILKEVMK